MIILLLLLLDVLCFIQELRRVCKWFSDKSSIVSLLSKAEQLSFNSRIICYVAFSWSIYYCLIHCGGICVWMWSFLSFPRTVCHYTIELPTSEVEDMAFSAIDTRCCQEDLSVMGKYKYRWMSPCCWWKRSPEVVYVKHHQVHSDYWNPYELMSFKIS